MASIQRRPSLDQVFCPHPEFDCPVNPPTVCDNASTCDKDEPDDVEDSEDDGNETQETELSAEDIVDLSDEDEEEDAYTSASCKHTLPKFHAIARKLRKSPNSKAEFILLCEEQECTKPHNIERDVRTRWNSTYFQLEGIIRCEKAILIWQKHRKYVLDRRYHVDRIDIQLARDLVAILELFYEQTLQVSTLGSPRLTHIIVFIDEITDHLSNAIKGDGNKYPPVLRNACRSGLQLTNKYYTLTDCSPLYRIAMVLHPSFKDRYFKIAGWEADWITEALRLTREMFNTFYKPNIEILPSSQPNKSNKPFQPKTGNIAQLALAAQPGLSATDPLDNWLASGLILDDGSPVNALKWWIRQKRAGNSHGGLAKMALDVLSCPATSVDFERAFSFGRAYLSEKRHRLSGVSISRGMSVAFYSKNNLIEPGVLRKWKNHLQVEKKQSSKGKGKEKD
ncbi:hypothetical protein PSTG_03286 [Puccinia striiformis f. sp. tritici PST-78]|uniref:HAT C-terminal dimerisation domain-containing protein n=1 Tax=Puccinia striiformis f. sp. tritici PST-78 TaxID=1165861 RepID=A0A0L0VVP2_9BASI|nr:hypothetical protein PSTG_03286 [Puccinia striiformis f. sp. tritici PST-78]